MHRLLHITLVSLLLLTTQSTPAWAHRHESLSPQELAVHLQQYHQGKPATQVPAGWHVHRSAVQLIDPALGRRADADLPGEGFDSVASLLTNSQNLSSDQAIQANAYDRRYWARSASFPLYYLHQSLLI